jgi:hypothetical protein
LRIWVIYSPKLAAGKDLLQKLKEKENKQPYKREEMENFKNTIMFGKTHFWLFSEF